MFDNFGLIWGSCLIKFSLFWRSFSSVIGFGGMLFDIIFFALLGIMLEIMLIILLGTMLEIMLGREY